MYGTCFWRLYWNIYSRKALPKLLNTCFCFLLFLTKKGSLENYFKTYLPIVLWNMILNVFSCTVYYHLITASLNFSCIAILRLVDSTRSSFGPHCFFVNHMNKIWISCASIIKKSFDFQGELYCMISHTRPIWSSVSRGAIFSIFLITGEDMRVWYCTFCIINKKNKQQ